MANNIDAESPGLQPTSLEAPPEREPREVCVGGLPWDFTEQELRAAFNHVGEVLEVRLPKQALGHCLGGAYVTFPDDLAAQRACEVKTVRNGLVPIGVVISRSVRVDTLDPGASMNVPLKLGQASDTLSKILGLLRPHSDGKALLASSMKGFMDSVSGKNIGNQGDDDDDPGRTEIRESAVLQPDMNSYLDKFPNCRDLMVQIRSTPNNDNKTPAGVLNEYATKLDLELKYDDSSEGTVGGFVTTCTMSSRDGNVLYAQGTGQAMKKKDAKQMSAAAALENLLESVPPSNFMQPGKNKLLRGGGGYWGRGRNLRGSMVGRQPRAGNRFRGPSIGHGPSPIVADKRKFEDLYTSTPSVNHSPPSGIMGGGGMVHGPGLNTMSNQGVGTAPLNMGTTVMGVGSHTMVGPVGMAGPMGTMAMRNGNSLQPIGTPNQMLRTGPNNFGVGLSSGNPCQIFGAPPLVASPNLPGNGAGMPMSNMLISPVGMVSPLDNLGANVHIADGTGAGPLVPEMGAVFGAPPGQFWAGV